MAAADGLLSSFALISLLLALESHAKLNPCRTPGNRSLFLWSVEEPGRRSRGYLFGTIHVPYTSVWDQVSDRVKEAYSRADTVAFEVDLHDESTMKRLMRCKNLRKRQNALSYLPHEVYRRIQKLMASVRNAILVAARKQAKTQEEHEEAVEKAMDVYAALIGGWERKRPEWLLFLLYQLCENIAEKGSSGSPILDLFLAERALADGKRILAIESVDEQCNPITTVSQEQLLFSINYTLGYLEKLHVNPHVDVMRKNRSIDDLVAGYRCGQLEEALNAGSSILRRDVILFDEATKRQQQIEDQLKKDIIVTRNDRMARRIHSMLHAHSGSKLFIAIGAGHLVGENNVLDHLRQLGFAVSPVHQLDEVSYMRNLPRDQRFNSLWVRRPPSDEDIDCGAFLIIYAGDNTIKRIHILKQKTASSKSVTRHRSPIKFLVGVFEMGVTLQFIEDDLAHSQNNCNHSMEYLRRSDWPTSSGTMSSILAKPEFSKWSTFVTLEKPLAKDDCSDVFLYAVTAFEKSESECLSHPPAPNPPSSRRTKEHGDGSCVQMPFEASDLLLNGRPRNEVVREVISDFASGVRDFDHLQTGIAKFNREVKIRSLRAIIGDITDEVERKRREEEMLLLLTRIAQVANQADELFTQNLPVLSAASAVRSVSLSQQQAACVLALAFFCTFPSQRLVFDNLAKKRRRINMTRFHTNTDALALEKMKFILSYFSQVTDEMPTGAISIRKVEWTDEGVDWRINETLLLNAKLLASHDFLIEDADGFLQVDFANKYIGGGVLDHGAVQEEIRFLITPELLISLLICEKMTDNLAFVITGAQRFSNYTGYGSKLGFCSSPPKREELRDSLGRANVHVVAMDATPYRRGKAAQYEEAAFKRELVKACAGFSRNEEDPARPVATGNWGCGAFRGDAQLKSLIQLVAAVKTGRDIAYFTFGDRELACDFARIYERICNLRVTIGQLYLWISEYPGDSSMFSHIEMNCDRLEK